MTGACPPRALVTGGRGFIGRAVVAELLRRGGQVTTFDLAPVDPGQDDHSAHHVVGDVRDRPALRAALAGSAWVFHLSGRLGTSELFADPATAIDVNILGALQVLEAAREAGAERVFMPAKPNEWHNIYSVTSQAVEKLAHSFRVGHGMDVRVLRILNVYGPGQALVPVRKAVPLFIAQALHGRALQLHGGGLQSMDPVFVHDAAARIVDFVQHGSAADRTFELPALEPVTVQALARRIITLCGSTAELQQAPQRLGEGADATFQRAPDVRTRLPPRPDTPLDDGLQQTIAWYRRLPSALFEATWRCHG